MVKGRDGRDPAEGEDDPGTYHDDRRNNMDITGERRLAITFWVTIIIFAGEAIGGYVSNSLALLSDAGHMATDALAMGIGLLAGRISKRPSDRYATFGYRRVGLLAALINGVSLLVIAGFIFYEAYMRIFSPPEIRLPLMLGIAIIGLAGNIIMAIILGPAHDDLNIKAVWLHVLGDTLSSVGVIVSGIGIYFTGWGYLDPIVGILIGVIIVWGGVRLIRDTLAIFLNLTPKGYDIKALTAEIAAIPEVVGIHDVHLWSLARDYVVFSAHILVNDQTLQEVETTKGHIERLLKEKGIAHTTLQLECRCANCNDGLYCQTNPYPDEKSQNHRNV